ncbi:hypothetical protein ACOMHN_057888 [Nucella lapillus]
MLVFIVFSFLWAPVALQELGDLQDVLTFAFGNQLNTVMSSCCVIRQLQCPVRQFWKMTSQQNVTNDVVRGLESFSHCICQNHRRCSLFFPAFFLPGDADGITYDVTFVTVTTTARYTCTYRSTRALVCQYRQGMRTGMMGWLMPGLGAYGSLEVLGRAGYLSEEVEEAMEAMVETGVHPAPSSRNWQSCRRCTPLQCALRVAREAKRLRVFLHRRVLSVARQRQRYHWCLRQNSMRPPQLPARLPPTTTTTPRPPGPFPLTPPPLLPPTPLLPTAPTPVIKTTPTTTTTTTRRPPPRITTEIVRPTTKTTAVTTTTTTSAATTTKRSTTTHNSSSLSNPSPLPTPTPPVKPRTTTAITTTTTTTVVTSPSTAREVTTPTAASEVTSSPMSSTTMKMTTTTPMVITRILVGSPAASPSLPPRRNAMGVGTKSGGGGILGGGEMAGMVIGVTIVIAAGIVCLIVRHRRHRHPHSLRDEVHGAGLPTSPRKRSRSNHKGKHLKVRNLTSASSKQAVMDGEDSGNVSDKMEDENDDANSVGSSEMNEERYVAPPTSTRSTKPQEYSSGDDSQSLYASLDETAILSLTNPGFLEDATNISGSTENRPRSEFKPYYNTASLQLPEKANTTNLSSRDSSQNVPGDISMLGPATEDMARKIPSNRNSKAGYSPGNSAPPASSGGPSKYYNLRPGPPKDVTVSPYASDTGSYVSSSSYVNGTSSISPYDKPGSQTAQYVYTTFKEPSVSKGPSVSTATTTTNTPSHHDGYLEPCITPAVPPKDIVSRAGGSKKKAKRSPVPEHSKMVTASNTSSIQDRDSNPGNAVRKVSVGSNSSREDNSMLTRGGDRHTSQSKSRTANVSYQDTKTLVVSSISAVEPPVDRDGYLLPVSPQMQHHHQL